MPVTPALAAARSPTATATASSSSSSSGGSAAPAPSRYPPATPRVGGDRIAEAAQPVDVAADRPRPDLEAVGEVGAGPLATALQQRQEVEQAGRRLEHDCAILAPIADQN